MKLPRYRASTDHYDWDRKGPLVEAQAAADAIRAAYAQGLLDMLRSNVLLLQETAGLCRGSPKREAFVRSLIRSIEGTEPWPMPPDPPCLTCQGTGIDPKWSYSRRPCEDCGDPL